MNNKTGQIKEFIFPELYVLFLFKDLYVVNWSFFLSGAHLLQPVLFNFTTKISSKIDK